MGSFTFVESPKDQFDKFWPVPNWSFNHMLLNTSVGAQYRANNPIKLAALHTYRNSGVDWIARVKLTCYVGFRSI